MLKLCLAILQRNRHHRLAHHRQRPERKQQQQRPRHQAVRAVILFPLGTVGPRPLHLGRLVIQP